MWADLNSAPWQQAVTVEAASGRAFCDGDPLKLHHDYGRARVGALPWERLTAGVEAGRVANSALEQLDPERVQWTFPTSVPDLPPRSRYDLELYSAWMTRRPGRPTTSR